jgi:hypothetical protein
MNSLTLDQVVNEMRIVGEQLIPYNYPLADRAVENFLNVVKVKECMVDGYEVILHYSKADYKTQFIESIQVYAKYLPFLPFNIVVKVGKKFLGPSKLMLVEQLKEGQKIYCWTLIVDRKGRPKADADYIDGSPELKYEDFTYSMLNRSAVTVS